jgi:putative protease
MIFWQDDMYAHARDVLRQRKQGAMLSKAEAADLKLPAAQ